MNDFLTKVYVTGFVAVRGFLSDQKGVTAVEYAIVLAGVAAVVAVIFGKDGTVQHMLEGIFSNVEKQVSASMSS